METGGSWLAHLEIATDFPGREVVDFPMTRDAAGLAIGRVPPDGLLCAFAEKPAALFPQVPFELGSLHAGSSSSSRMTSADSCCRAIPRFASRTMRRASFRFLRASASVAPCVFTPGISST